MTARNRKRNADYSSTAAKDPVDGGRSVPTGKPDVDNGRHGTGTQPGQPRPESLPHGTTKDQINEMESEGQAEKPGQDTPPDTSPTRRDA